LWCAGSAARIATPIFLLAALFKIFQITRKPMPLIGQTSYQLPSNTTIYLVILILITKYIVAFDGK
jgi:hypothetical protein